MKIVSITTEEFRWPRHVPIRNGKHTYTHSGLGIVKIETDENITGIGLGGTGLIGQATIETLKRELIGEDLERHMAPQADVFGAIDYAHAAGAQLLDNAVMNEGLAEHLGEG